MVLILPYIYYHANWWIVLESNRFINSTQIFSSVLKFLSCYEEKKLRKDKKESILQYDHVARKYCFVTFTALQLTYVILCTNLMMMQTIKGKVPCIYKELIKRIMTFECEKLLLLKTMQNKWQQILQSLKKTKHFRHVIYARSISR